MFSFSFSFYVLFSFLLFLLSLPRIFGLQTLPYLLALALHIWAFSPNKILGDGLWSLLDNPFLQFLFQKLSLAFPIDWLHVYSYAGEHKSNFFAYCSHNRCSFPKVPAADIVRLIFTQYSYKKMVLNQFFTVCSFLHGTLSPIFIFGYVGTNFCRRYIINFLLEHNVLLSVSN